MPVPYANFRDPQSLNLYSYVRGIPTTLADVDGHGFWAKLGNAFGDAACWCEGQAAEKSKKERREQREESELVMQIAARDPRNQEIFVAWILTAFGETLPNGTGNGSSTSEEAAEEEAPGIRANAERGAASEKRVLNDLGKAKNTQPVVGKEGKSIPDFQDSRTVGEIKDAKTVSNTSQLRIQKEAAQNSGRQHGLHTGAKTHVTKPAAQGTSVIRRDDLGPN